MIYFLEMNKKNKIIYILLIVVVFTLSVYFFFLGLRDFNVVEKAKKISDDIGLGGLVTSIGYVVNFVISLILFLIGLTQLKSLIVKWNRNQ